MKAPAHTAPAVASPRPSFRPLLIGLLWLAPLLLGLTAPLPPELTAEEEAKLGKENAIVVHPELPTTDPAHVRARVIAEINAPPEIVWKELLNFQARVAENGPLKVVTVYENEWTGSKLRRKAKWEIKVLGREIKFHCRYQHDRDLSYLEWNLDEEKENDVVFSWGSYQVFSSTIRPGKSRLVYTSESMSGYKLPRWINRRIAVRGLDELARGVRKRSEDAYTAN